MLKMKLDEQGAMRSKIRLRIAPADNVRYVAAVRCAADRRVAGPVWQVETAQLPRPFHGCTPDDDRRVSSDE